MKHKKVFLVLWILFLVFCAYNVLNFAAQKDREMFREELIWFSRFQIVEEMYLNGLSDGEIYDILVFQVKKGWGFSEITDCLDILKSY